VAVLGAAGTHAGRRGQASAITVAILASAALALGVALYGYFSSQAAEASRRQGLVDLYAQYANSVYARVEASMLGEAPDNSGTLLGCYAVTIHNLGATPYRVEVSVAPAARSAGGMVVYSEIERIPLDYQAVSLGGQPLPRVFVYRLEDVDGDGLMEAVGSGVVQGEPYLPTCDSLYSNRTAKNLALPPEALPASTILAGPQGPDLATLARGAGASIDSLPVWGFTVQPGGSVSLFIYAEMPVEPRRLSLLLAFELGGNHYVYATVSLPLTQPTP
jgi:hypothetical protein